MLIVAKLCLLFVCLARGYGIWTTTKTKQRHGKRINKRRILFSFFFFLMPENSLKCITWPMHWQKLHAVHYFTTKTIHEQNFWSHPNRKFEEFARAVCLFVQLHGYKNQWLDSFRFTSISVCFVLLLLSSSKTTKMDTTTTTPGSSHLFSYNDDSDDDISGYKYI